MDASLFAQMMADPSVVDLKKLHYKYPAADISEFIDLLKDTVYSKIPLPDFSGNEFVYLDNVTRVRMKSLKLLLQKQESGIFSLKAMEEEIASTMEIEGIDTSRDSVRRILQGYAPVSDEESRIYGMKLGLDFIADPSHAITEENIYQLYQMTIGNYLDEDDRLLHGNHYRHDAVYIVGENIEHIGLSHDKLPEYMEKLVAFIQSDSEMNDLVKAAVIHFYLAYLHPYFDGNGRMARFLHLWYLVQNGYSSALFVPFSALINQSRRGYYKAYSLAEENEKQSGVMDVTPFLTYFISEVYDKLEQVMPDVSVQNSFLEILQSGQVTEKEKSLWNYILSAYGTEPFSTKQLEKDYGDAAYATIRGFVQKFERFGLLESQRYSNRIRYKIRGK